MRKKLVDVLKNAKNVLMLCHKNADPDAVCSALALGTYISRFLKKNVHYVAVDGVSALSKKVLESLKVGVVFNDHIYDVSPYDAIILVDTGSLDQVKPLDEQILKEGKTLLVVDHHHENEKLAKIARLYLVDTAAPSTAEIVYKILRRSKVLRDSVICQALLIGLIYDSRRFAIASYDTIKIALDLMRRGADYNKVLTLLKSEASYSEKIARLKACQRAKLYSLRNEWIIAFSHVGSYEASAARSLIDLGADLALVLNQEDDVSRVSIRANDRFNNLLEGDAIKDLILHLSRSLKGEGGGHALAAGFIGKFSLEELENATISWLRKRVSQEVKLIT